MDHLDLDRLLDDPSVPKFANGTLPTSVFGWKELCQENPDNQFCVDNVPNNYHYILNNTANIAFTVVFAISLLAFLVTYVVFRRGFAFTTALVLGTLCEVLGYIGRVMSYENPWKPSGFMIQICCLTIGPAFMAAGIYLCLRRIVIIYGVENSPIAPAWYTRIFIPCDVVSLLLQAAGGGMASMATNREEAQPGTNVMIAGLAFQVLTVVVFSIAGSVFAARVWRRHREVGEAAFNSSPERRVIRQSLKFKWFIGALILATLLILWRSVFRVAELSSGWDGALMADQDIFIAFEGVLIVVAVYLLNIFNPIFCCGNLMKSGFTKIEGRSPDDVEHKTGYSASY